MPKPTTEIVEEILQSILATPKKQRRLKSSTFWDKFSIPKRTKDRVGEIATAFENAGIVVSIANGTLGIEGKDDWIILSYLDPELPSNTEKPVPRIATPHDDWFALLANREYESEREVEHYYILPLLEKLGYLEADIAIGLPVQMFQGTKKVTTEADVVLFKGSSRAPEHALMVVEAKKSNRVLTDEHHGQVHSYAMWLTTPLSMITNGDDLRVYAFRGAAQPDVLLLSLRRSELQQKWAELYAIVNRAAVVDYKEKVGKLQLAEQVSR